VPSLVAAALSYATEGDADADASAITRCDADIVVNFGGETDTDASPMTCCDADIVDKFGGETDTDASSMTRFCSQQFSSVQIASVHAVVVFSFVSVSESQSVDGALAQVSFGSQQSVVFSPQTSCGHGLVVLCCENPAPQSPALHSAWSSQHSVTVQDAESHAVVVERFVCVEVSHKLVGAFAHTSLAVQHSLVSI
jgi:hypothetical protein